MHKHPYKLCMVLLLYAIIPCLAAYNYTDLVSLIFGTAIPTSFNILMKCFTIHLLIIIVACHHPCFCQNSAPCFYNLCVATYALCRILPPSLQRVYQICTYMLVHL